ncbi:hypothetical protein B6U90_00495 [Thermoplasmatales archaeon ex4484_6]|nr:MAG: hypothetical protein B6U90_00495 [Thermoplasmatales archaeon ex4484_6]RLF69470.1 MAG: hypothetical protein DRN57_00755 [Thermoplasmata archaeon]
MIHVVRIGMRPLAQTKGIWSGFLHGKLFQIGRKVRLGKQSFGFGSLFELSMDLPLVPIRIFEPDTILGSLKV